MYIHIIELADRIDDSHEEPQTDKTLKFFTDVTRVRSFVEQEMHPGSLLVGDIIGVSSAILCRCLLTFPRVTLLRHTTLLSRSRIAEIATRRFIR